MQFVQAIEEERHGPDPFTLFGMSNRVEHQKLNQVAAELPSG